MAKDKQKFVNKIKDLEAQQYEHPEDFFRKAFQEINGAEEPYLFSAVAKESAPELNLPEEQWLGVNYDGQLGVDIFQEGDKLVVQAAVAGVKPEDIEVALNNDTLTIKGFRENKTQQGKREYLTQECYWGGFSRSIILPFDVKQDEIQAKLENGIITVTLPISKKSKYTKIEVKEVKE